MGGPQNSDERHERTYRQRDVSDVWFRSSGQSSGRCWKRSQEKAYGNVGVAGGNPSDGIDEPWGGDGVVLDAEQMRCFAFVFKAPPIILPGIRRHGLVDHHLDRQRLEQSNQPTVQVCSRGVRLYATVDQEREAESARRRRMNERSRSTGTASSADRAFLRS